MTAYPEAMLARELGLCYASIALVTDYDVGVERARRSGETVMRVFAENNGRLRDLLFAAIPRIGPQPQNDVCATALAGARVSA